MASIASRTRLPFAAGVALALAACGQQPEERATYEAGVTDKSGQLIVTEETPGIEVQLPQTRMTPVAPGETPRSGATPSPTAEPAPDPAG